MRFINRSEDRIWAPAEPFVDLTPAVIRHLGPTDGWQPEMAPTAVVRGVGHPSHGRINGWPYVYLGTTPDGNAIYQAI